MAPCRPRAGASKRGLPSVVGQRPRHKVRERERRETHRASVGIDEVHKFFHGGGVLIASPVFDHHPGGDGPGRVGAHGIPRHADGMWAGSWGRRGH